MEWLFGLALLPLLLCGAMCAGAMLLAVLGFRRSEQQGDHHGGTGDEHDEPAGRSVERL